MRPTAINNWDEIEDRRPAAALVGNIDLVIVRYDDEHPVLHGRCHHRGAMLADGTVTDENLLMQHLAGVPYGGINQ